MENKQIIGLFVHNHPGVLLRVTSLISRRGFNIDSLTVSPAAVEGYSRMTIRLQGNEDDVDQFINQIMKIVDVKKAEVMPVGGSVASELMLIKVNMSGHDTNDILGVTSKYHASLVNLGETSMTFRASGSPGDIDNLVAEMTPFGILEMARTGIAALEYGDKCLNS